MALAELSERDAGHTRPGALLPTAEKEEAAAIERAQADRGVRPGRQTGTRRARPRDPRGTLSAGPGAAREQEQGHVHDRDEGIEL